MFLCGITTQDFKALATETAHIHAVNLCKAQNTIGDTLKPFVYKLRGSCVGSAITPLRANLGNVVVRKGYVHSRAQTANPFRQQFGSGHSASVTFKFLYIERVKRKLDAFLV